MTLTEKVRKLQSNRIAINRDASLKRAEKLADQFADIRPQPLQMPMEKYFGTPSFHNDKNAC